jgi:hemerythrin-like metal-binding protein
MPMEWKDEFATGIPGIDDQHKELFHRIGKLHDALREGKAGEELGQILAFLVAYTRDHFREEEELMAAHHYILLPSHRSEHQGLVRQLAAWIETDGTPDLRLTLDVASKLAEWLRAHILKSDLAYARVIGDKRKAA